jgi:topoisomerase-4 subunit A
VLGDAKALSDMIVAEIEADAAKYGDARRTQIEAAASPVLVRTVPDEPVTITLSRNGWIRSRQGHGLDATQFTYKAGDGPLAVMETRTIHSIVILDTRGRAYTIRAADVPGGRGDGSPVTTLIELQSGAKVAQAISGETDRRYLVASSGGYGFIATLEDMVSRQKAGKAFMSMDDDESPIRPVLVTPGFDHVCRPDREGQAPRLRPRRDAHHGTRTRRHDDAPRRRRSSRGRRARHGAARDAARHLARQGDGRRDRGRGARAASPPPGAQGYLLARRFKPEGFG